MTMTRRILLMGLLSLPALTNAPEALSAQRGQDFSRQRKLLLAARSQIGVTTTYDPTYVRLTYPNGDVPEDRGVCIDVVIRAYRKAFGFDFQKVIHEDMSASFASYPAKWGLKRPDRNIDHRRVPNLATWLARNDYEQDKHEGWQAGDLITCSLPGNLPHICIVSRAAEADTLMLKVIHNIGRGTQEENLWLTGLSDIRRFRFLPDVP